MRLRASIPKCWSSATADQLPSQKTLRTSSSTPVASLVSLERRALNDCPPKWRSQNVCVDLKKSGSPRDRGRRHPRQVPDVNIGNSTVHYQPLTTCYYTGPRLDLTHPPPTPALPHKGGGSSFLSLPPCGGGLGWGAGEEVSQLPASIIYTA